MDLQSQQSLIDDKDIALKLVKASGKEVSKVSQRLRDDEEIILKAIPNDSIALQYASNRLKNDKKFIEKAIDAARINFPKLLLGIPEDFKDDKELMLKLINKDKAGNVINYVSDRLKDDFDIVCETVKQNATSIVYASEKCQNNKEIALLVVLNKGYALHFISDELRGDKEVVLAAVKNYGESLQSASKELRNNKDIVLAAVAHNGNALRYASDELKNDLEVALASYKSVKQSVQYFSKEIKKKINGINKQKLEQFMESLMLKENLEEEIPMHSTIIKKPKI
jgi:hypothetical protein